MGALLIARPTSEPVSLAEARKHLRIDTADLDAAIAAQIIAAREFIEGYTRRALVPQTWDFTYDWEWPCDRNGYRIVPPIAPVISVTHVQYVDGDGATQTLAANQYQVVGLGDDSLPRIVPAYGVSWPSVRDQPETVTVRCVCGYEFGSPAVVSIPQALKQALLLQVEILHDRDPTQKGLLEAARDALMDPYRVIHL